jgi:hypothetical protein
MAMEAICEPESLAIEKHIDRGEHLAPEHGLHELTREFLVQCDPRLHAAINLDVVNGDELKRESLILGR